MGTLPLISRLRLAGSFRPSRPLLTRQSLDPKLTKEAGGRPALGLGVLYRQLDDPGDDRAERLEPSWACSSRWRARYCRM